MLAAAMGDMTTVLALLRMPGVDRRLACAIGKDAVDYAVQHGKRDIDRLCCVQVSSVCVIFPCLRF